MDAGLADHVVHKSEFINNRAERGHNIAEHLTALPMRAKIPDRPHPRPKPIIEGLDGFAKIARLAVTLDQFGLVVEEVDMAGRTGHEKLDDAFCFRRMMKLSHGWTRCVRREQLTLP